MHKKVINRRANNAKNRRLKRVKIGVIAIAIISVLGLGSYAGFSIVSGYISNNTSSNTASNSIISKAIGASTSNNNAVLGWTEPGDPWYNLYQVFIKWIAFIRFWWAIKPASQKILVLAKEYSLPYDSIESGDNSQRYKDDATSSYQDLGDKDAWFDKNGLDRSDYSNDWSDCGVFVGSIIKAGFDANYPAKGAGMQYDYVHKATTIWEHNHIVNQDDLNEYVKAGDIFLITNHGSEGHAMISKSNKGTYAYMASWGSQVPNLRGDIGSWIFSRYPGYDMITARLINQKTYIY